MFFSRRDFLKTSTLASAGAVLGGVRCRVAKENPYRGSQPHIIYIMTDQHRGDCLGCMGNEAIKTPYIDALAADGVVFSSGYTATPSCTPARSGLLTGLSPWHHGMLGYGRVAGTYRYELPRMLREAGYYTFGIGKMHWYPQKTTHGFHGTLVDESGRVETEGFVSDYRDWFHLQAPGQDPDATGIGWNEHQAGVYVPEERLHPTAWTGRTAVEFIRNYNLNQPLLLKVSFSRPHSPYDPPQRFLDMYRETDIPVPYRGDWCSRFADFPETKTAAFGDFGIAHAINSRRHYYANVTFIDEQVGNIIWELKRRGMYDNALIMFTADHGDMLGDHYHWRKTYAYEGSAHIPYIMKWPEGLETSLDRGDTLANPVELRDFLPTFLDAAGKDIPEDMDGASLLSLVREHSAPWREYIDMEHSTCYDHDNYWCALTDGKMKYIYFFPTGEEQLFDVEQDPGELYELSTRPDLAATLGIWRRRMVEHLAERGDAWVKNGELQIRKKGMVYGPNYPAR